jgi:hypothetical protein
LAEFTEMLASPAMLFNRAMLEIPFVNPAVSIHPTRPPPIRDPCFGADALGIREAGHPFWRRNIGKTVANWHDGVRLVVKTAVGLI